MTDPHEPLKFKINNSLSRIRHRKPATRGAWCSLNSLEIGPESLYNLFQEYSTLDSPDLTPGRTQLGTNRTNRTRSSGGKYESARFWGPPEYW